MARMRTNRLAKAHSTSSVRWNSEISCEMLLPLFMSTTLKAALPWNSYMLSPPQHRRHLRPQQHSTSRSDSSCDMAKCGKPSAHVPCPLPPGGYAIITVLS